MRRGIVLAALVALGFVCFGATAQAKMGLTVGLDLDLGLGGELGLEGADGQVDTEDDLDATVGLNLFALYELLRFLDLGGHVGFHWWETDSGTDRNLFVDIGPTLRGKVGLLGGDLQLHLSLPTGLTIGRLGTEIQNVDQTGAGFHIGLLFGADYRVWSGLRPFLELGWMLHFVSHGVNGASNVDGITNQFALNFGVAYEF